MESEFISLMHQSVDIDRSNFKVTSKIADENFTQIKLTVLRHLNFIKLTGKVILLSPNTQ